MGRTSTSLGASHGRPGFVDRSAPRVLSVPERCRFGRCFSGMVLKILGQTARLQEVNP